MVIDDCHTIGCPYSKGVSKETFDSTIIVSVKKPNFTPRKDPRKGSEDRKPTGDRERNVGHPEGEEHSRVPKGNGTGRKKAEGNNNVLNKPFPYVDFNLMFNPFSRHPWERRYDDVWLTGDEVWLTGDESFWEIINPFRKR